MTRKAKAAPVRGPKYRKVEVATWIDGAFCSLSAPPPNGRTLWLYLLTGPRTTTFPGLVVAREAVMASDLGWTIEGLREALSELCTAQLIDVDEESGVVLLRKALFNGPDYSRSSIRETAKPESPNVIKGWAKSWSDVPDGKLKYQYLCLLGAFAEALGERYVEAYREAFAKALAKPYRKALGNPSTDPSSNQEQEQEQEQEEGRDASLFPSLGRLANKTKPKPRKPKTERQVSAEDAELESTSARLVLSKLGERNGVKYTGTDEHIRLIRNLFARGLTEMDLRAIVAFICAPKSSGGKGWLYDESMRTHVCPETLFGPKTHTKYLDAARSWAEKRIPGFSAGMATPVVVANDDIASAASKSEAVPATIEMSFNGRLMSVPASGGGGW